MLREGIQSFHGQRIELPRALRDRPSPGRLERRFERFVAAGLTG